MGCAFILSGGFESTGNVNPDPKSFKVQSSTYANGYTVAEIIYNGCINFEGRKILLFEGDVRAEVAKAVEIDPHFRASGSLRPVARFEPSDRGASLVAELMAMVRVR